MEHEGISWNISSSVWMVKTVEVEWGIDRLGW